MSSGNVATDILSLADTHADRTALVMGDQSVTFADLSAAAGRAAAAVRGLGIPTGTRVGVYLPSSPVWLATYLGLQDAGYTPVVLNAMLTRVELEDILSRVDVPVVVVDSTGAQRISGLRAGSGADVVPMVVEPLADLATAYAGETASPLVGCREHDAVVMMTSGTVGRPKAAALTHTNMAFGTACGAYCVGISPGCTVVTAAPMFYDMGIHTLTLTTLNHGGTMVVQDRFDAPSFVDLVATHRPQVLAGTPTVFLRIAAEGAERRLRVAETESCIAGGAAMEAKAADQLAAMFPAAAVRQIYGMTEVRTLTGSRPEQQAPSSSIGKVIPGVYLRLVDPQGAPVDAPDEIGELVVHSPGVMRGYLSGERDMFLPGGWMRTGDLASRDDQGWFYFRGRTKEMITRGGANVYPREIEEALTTAPGIGEVAVVGQPHPELGEVPVAYYVASPGESAPDPERLAAYARERLSAYKIPVSFHEVPELPRNAAGKVTKRRLLPSSPEHHSAVPVEAQGPTVTDPRRSTP